MWKSGWSWIPRKEPCLPKEALRPHTCHTQWLNGDIASVSCLDFEEEKVPSITELSMSQSCQHNVALIVDTSSYDIKEVAKIIQHLHLWFITARYPYFWSLLYAGAPYIGRYIGRYIGLERVWGIGLMTVF